MQDEDEVLAVTEASEEPTEVETDAPAALEGDEPTENTTEGEEPEKPKPKRGVQKRIDKLTKRVREQERLISDLQQPREQVAAAPNRDDFDDYELFIEAKVDHQAGVRIAQMEAKQRDTAAQQNHADASAHFEQSRDDLVDAGSETYSDFSEVALSENLEISPTMAEALLASNQGHDLWYHLGKNPGKAEKIASMSAVQQVLAIGELAVSLKTAKKPSNAPKTTKSVGSRGSSSADPSDKSDIKEWMSKRNKQIRG